MKELNELLELINAEYVICDDNVEVSELNCEYKIIKDVRSAAFYAFGKSIATNKNVALIINGEYLSNTYTVLTEAWFQKANLIVIAQYDSIYNIETNYLDRCTTCNITFIDKDYSKFKERIENSLRLIGPKLFNIVIEREQRKINYESITNDIKKFLQSEDTIFIYNSEEIEVPCKIKNIEEKYKYGLFSKYVGYINVLNKGKQILICPKECLEIDLNILNNRAMNKNFKAIVIGNIEHLKEWIEKNNINLITSKNGLNDAEKLYNSTTATILNFEEGE